MRTALIVLGVLAALGGAAWFFVLRKPKASPTAFPTDAPLLGVAGPEAFSPTASLTPAFAPVAPVPPPPTAAKAALIFKAGF